MSQALVSLDAPRTLTHRMRVWQWVGAAVFLVLVALAVVFNATPLPRVPAAVLVNTTIGAFICGVTALLMFSQARSTCRRGFLWAGMTFEYMAGMLLVFPLYFPGAVLPGQQILGNSQSALMLNIARHIAFPVGLTVATWLLYSDRRQHRRPSLTNGQMWAGFLGTLLALLVTMLMASVIPAGVAPDVMTVEQTKTGFAVALEILVVLLALGFMGVAFYCARTGSVIGRWLAATSLLAVGEAVLNVMTVQRYSVGWYSSRFVWLTAASVLLVSLIWNLSRVDRANAELATVDSLTGADSRLAFLGSVHREIGRMRDVGGRVAMLWIDLDGFKGINDQLGHEAGDSVLRTVVDRLGQQVRVNDHVGRLGGDEFGVLLHDYTSRDQVHKVAQRLLAAVREPIRYDGSDLHVTAAVGIATAPDDALTADDLLLQADLAMYAAKKAGGDSWVDFSPAISADAAGRGRLRQALAEGLRDRAFRVHYQPIFEADGIRMAGVESLARWIRDGEALSAGEFVQFAEGSGQIVHIGRLMLAELAQDVPRWIAANDEDFFICLNLSVREVCDRTIVDELVAGPLSQYASRLMVEITESLELQESSEATANLERIRTAGMRIAIDDFGAGFSNFTRLEKLRPSLLKIDRALVRRAGSEVEGGVAFLTAATSVAATLNCDVVAEGVQTQGEAQVVQLLGVRYVQGYRYARPAPIEHWLDTVTVP